MISPNPTNEGDHPTKKKLILKICDEQDFSVITTKEIEMINDELENRLGSEGRTSAAYIANILVKAGKDVRYKDVLVKTKPPEAYEKELEGLLQFKDLDQAEQTLRKMIELYEQFKQKREKAGIEYLRDLAEKGYRRCNMIAKNEKVDSSKREEKKEIAFWFKLWKDSPRIFTQWLDLRLQSQEFREKFGKN